MAKKRNDRESKDRRRNEANIRNEVWASFSPERQLIMIDNLFGKGLGAKKQRARLARLIK